MKKNSKQYQLMISILSLSLLTVMAGAAVAPALNVIRHYFSDSNPVFVQMIISIPAVFIALTSFFFPRLCSIFGSKTLVAGGLILYTAGGCIAGVFNQISLILLARALVGIGVGIIMPLSTGLLTFYFPPEEQEKLMGYSSAMNQMGGVIATLLAGFLAEISWRASFAVYLLGFISLIPCLIFLPNDKMHVEKAASKKGICHIFRDYYLYIIAMFLLMTVFFVYPVNFAMETAATGLIPQKYIAMIMAMMDLLAFFGGLTFVFIKKCCCNRTKFVSPLLFLSGYLLLSFNGGWFTILSGSVLIGFANGAGIPYLISEASLKAGKSAVTTVMPLISAALYLAQFLSPVFLSIASLLVGDISHLSYRFAVIISVIFCLWSARIPNIENTSEPRV